MYENVRDTFKFYQVSLFVVSSSFFYPLYCTIITTCFSNRTYETSAIVYVLGPA